MTPQLVQLAFRGVHGSWQILGCKVGGVMAWVYLVLTIAAGGFFYWLRVRNRLLYGLSEILVALLIMVLLWFPYGPVVLQVAGDTFWDQLLPKVVSIFVGIYAFVRGCDNIAAGLDSS